MADMNQIIRRAAGYTVDTKEPPTKTNQAMNELIRRAAGRLPQETKGTDDDRND